MNTAVKLIKNKVGQMDLPPGVAMLLEGLELN